MEIIRQMGDSVTIRLDKDEVMALSKELREGSPIFFKLFDMIHTAEDVWQPQSI